MPVVENLEDMWLVTKLQNERKAKQEKEKALQEMRQLQDAQAASKVRPTVLCNVTSQTVI